MASNPFPDATGMHKTKSPFGEFKLTSLETGTIIQCPVTGSNLKNQYQDREDTYAVEHPLKNHRLRAKNFYTTGDVDILIHHLRHTKCCNTNTNEARTGTFKKGRR
mmetsp:Transcript_29479/g.56611  ORF Transcript_29479/g.56611 Transcript_29479/m.56611 type:complete len:106 (+) Transcript_29479:103-420(+)